MIGLELLDRVTLRLEHREQSVRPDQVGGADHDERAALARKSASIFGSQSLLRSTSRRWYIPGSLRRSCSTIRSTVGRRLRFQALARRRDRRLLGFELRQRRREHPILLLHRHVVEARDLESRSSRAPATSLPAATAWS